MIGVLFFLTDFMNQNHKPNGSTRGLFQGIVPEDKLIRTRERFVPVRNERAQDEPGT